jgi:type IV secretory pathway VirB2 component (pilin)
MKKIKIFFAFLLIFGVILFFFPEKTFAQSQLTSLGRIRQTIEAIAGVSAVLMIVIGGFQWMTSVGDPAKISDAKDRIYSALLGLVIVALAEVIARLLKP